MVTWTSNAKATVYIDEATFLSALSGYSISFEGFEDTAVWGGVRTPSSASSITNLGLTWTSNFAAGNITTSNGAARTGGWGIYSTPHGSYATGGASCDTPGVCGDGLIGSAANGGVLYAVGGWFRTNTPFAELSLSIPTYGDGTNTVDFGESCDSNGENCVSNAILGTGYKFFGVIDLAGFASFEFRELEGTRFDQKFIFGDDFYFVTQNAVPLPATLPLFVSGAGLLGFLGWRRKKRMAKAVA